MKSLSKSVYAALAAIAILIIGMCYYFFYYTKTPEYTIQLIAEAWQAHDPAKVEKYIDIESIAGFFVDEVISSDPEIQKNPFAAAIISAMKPMAVAAIKEDVRKAITEQPSNETQGKTNTAQKKIPSQNIIQTTKSVSISSLSSEKLDDTSAVIKLTLKNKAGQELPLTLKARRNADDTWQIYEAPGLYKLTQELKQKSSSSQT